MTEEQGLVESRLAEKEAQLAEASARVAELERALAGKDEEIVGLKQSGREMEKKLAALSDSFKAAVTSYKTAVVQANPEVVAELVSGETIEAVNESLEKAKELVGRVRRGVESEIARSRVPAGAPERTPADLSALTPREKIQYAMGRK